MLTQPLLPEESHDVLMEMVNGRDQHSAWLIAKRGMMFSEGAIPNECDIDWLKDITHVYRVRKTERKRGRREWESTLWVDGSPTQRSVTHKKVRGPQEIIYASRYLD
jgi:hypothetical protein